MMESAILQAETDLLRWLCQADDKDSLRSQVLEAIHSYPFHSTEHQMLFDCLWELRGSAPGRCRDWIPAWLVRAGFPDVDLAPYFEPFVLSDFEIAKLLGLLLGAK